MDRTDLVRVKHVKFKWSWIFLLLFWMPQVTLASDVKRTDLKRKEEMIAGTHGASILLLTTHLIRKYPPDEWTYLFLGRSPTPLYAAITLCESCSGMSVLTLPFSDGKNLPYLLREEIEKKTETMSSGKGVTSFESFTYVPTVYKPNESLYSKLLMHIDVYVGPWVTQILAKKQKRKLVVVDYVESGFGLGYFMSALKDYLSMTWSEQSLFQQDPITLSYFGFHNPQYPASKIAQNIDASVKASLSPKEVSLPSTLGLPLQPHWGNLLEAPSKPIHIKQGTLISLDSSRYHSLGGAFQSSTFDAYAPKGPWYLSKDPLEKTPRPLSEKFKKFRDALKMTCLDFQTLGALESTGYN